jgi:hypothetical protein
VNGDPRDPLDDAIARDLGALAPDDLDADAALGAMRPALRRARTRRRAAVTSSVVGALVVVVGVGVLLAGQGTSRIHVEGPPTTLAPTVVTPSTRKANPTTTVPPSGGTTTTVTSPSVTTPDTTPGTPTTGDHGGTSQPTSGSTPTSKPPAAPSTKTYTSIGGRITVTFANGTLTLDSSHATAGYQTELHKQDPDDVEVRFSSGNRESRIRIRVQNGVVQKEITET